MMKINGLDPNFWICLCGNTPMADGFFPCDHEGALVEPTPEEWTTNWYVCERCGRIIDQATTEVVGFRADNTLSEAECPKIRAKG